MPVTVRATLAARLEALRAKKARLAIDAQALQAEIDAVKAEQDGLAPADDDRLARLQQLGVIRTSD